MDTIRIKSPWDKKGRWMQVDARGMISMCPYTHKHVKLHHVTDGVARIPIGLKTNVAGDYLSPCCGAHPTYIEATLCCRKCCREIPNAPLD